MSARFDDNYDLYLLREVVVTKVDPQERGASHWMDITETLNKMLEDEATEKNGKVKTFKKRQIRDRAVKLLEDYRQKRRESERASGAEEVEECELDELLESWDSILLDIKENKKALEKKQQNQGLVVREQAMKSLKRPLKTKQNDNESDDDTEPPELDFEPDTVKKRGKKSGSGKDHGKELFGYLDERNRIRQKELEIEYRKIKLEEQRAEANKLLMEKLIQKL